MDWLEQAVQDLAALLSRLLDPVAIGVEVVNSIVKHQLAVFGMPLNWQATVIPSLWALVLLLTLRTLTGWARIVAIVVVVVSLTKIFGFLPER